MRAAIIIPATLQIPKIYDRKTIETFSEIVDVTYGIFEKVIKNIWMIPNL